MNTTLNTTHIIYYGGGANPIGSSQLLGVSSGAPESELPVVCGEGNHEDPIYMACHGITLSLDPNFLVFTDMVNTSTMFK